MLNISYFALSFSVTLWFTRFLIRYLDPTYFMDRPDERKIHLTPIPRIGGIAFAPVIIILGWFIFNDWGGYTWYFLGALSMFLLGSLDDYFNISWKLKMPVQLLIGSLIVLQFFPYIDTVIFFDKTLPFSRWLLMVIFILWFIGISNAINLIDGMDGLAGGFMLLVSFAATILGYFSEQFTFTAINIIFIAALLAFLHYNQRPAKIFMGDSGSLFLGYHLAVLPLLYSVRPAGISETVNITPFIFLSTYLIADTLRVFFNRVFRGRHPLEPDQSHLHYEILNRGKSHHGTLFAIFILCGIGCVLSVVSMFWTVQPTMLMVSYLLIISACVFIPAVSDNFIKWVVKLNHQTIWVNKGTNSLLKIFNTRIISLLTLTYFMALMMINFSHWTQLLNPPFVMIILTIIALFTFRETTLYVKSHTALLLSIGIFHFYLLLSGFWDASGTVVHTAVSPALAFLRYGSLLLIATAVISNYILQASQIADYWSVIDLIVVFLLVGMVGIQPLGMGVPFTFSFEFGIIYFANKLVIPVFSAALAKSQVSA